MTTLMRLRKVNKKGIIVSYLCVNSGCPFSEEKIKDKQVLTSNSKGDVHSFKTLSVCPKCKSSVELITFSPANVEIVKEE